jgi:hypothetical protein
MVNPSAPPQWTPPIWVETGVFAVGEQHQRLATQPLRGRAALLSWQFEQLFCADPMAPPPSLAGR